MKTRRKLYSNLCVQTVFDVQPKSVSLRFLNVWTFKTLMYSAPTENGKALSNHSQPCWDIWKDATVRDQTGPWVCRFRWRTFWAFVVKCDLINNKNSTFIGNVCRNCILSVVSKMLRTYRYLFLSVIVSGNSQTTHCWTYICMNRFLCCGAQNVLSNFSPAFYMHLVCVMSLDRWLVYEETNWTLIPSSCREHMIDCVVLLCAVWQGTGCWYCPVGGWMDEERCTRAKLGIYIRWIKLDSFSYWRAGWTVSSKYLEIWITIYTGGYLVTVIG